MKKNKVLLWGIVFAIAVQLAACGSGNKDSASQEKMLLLKKAARRQEITRANL